MAVTPKDLELLEALAEGLPLVPEPFVMLGRRVGLSGAEVIERLQALLAEGVLQRFGVVVRHHELGYRANAMVVWDVPDDQAPELGPRMAAFPFVTLCYLRRRYQPLWRYNLFCMIHGRERGAVLAQIEDLTSALGLTDTPRDILFSRRRFKQRGARYGADAAVAMGASR